MTGVVKRRRVTTAVACNACRESKRSCDGAKPICSYCRRTGKSCAYRAHRSLVLAKDIDEQSEVYAKFITLLHSLPQDEIHAVLGQISTMDGIPAAMSFIQANLQSNPLLCLNGPSNVRHARAVSPSSHSSLEFELMCQHNLTYPWIQTPNKDDLASLLGNENSQRRAFPSTDLQASRSHTYRDQFVIGLTKASSAGMPPTAKEDSTTTKDPYESKYHDKRLDNLNIGYWIKTAISNEVAASLLSFFLETDHKSQGIFDADLFIDDLVNCHTSFCSSFLVISALYLISQKYIAIDPRTHFLREAFGQEAEMLWRGEANNDSIVSVAGLILFSGAALWDANETLGLEVAAAARRMSERLGLYGVRFVPPSSKALALCDESPEWARATCHTAWGSYNWDAMLSLWYYHTGILHPPTLPIPGGGTIPGSCDKPPLHTPRVFPATCCLWTVAMEIQEVYTASSEGSIHKRVAIAFVEAKYRKLLSIMSAAGEDVRRDKHSCTSIVTFHGYFHAVVFMLMRPFANAPGSAQQQMRSFTAIDASPKAIYISSLHQLKDLLYTYYMNGTHVDTQLWLNPAQLALCLAVLEDTRNALWRYYFLLCLRYWRRLYLCYPVFHGEVKGFLSLALQKKAITSREARGLQRYIEGNGLHHNASLEQVTSIMFDTASSAIEESRLRSTAAAFENLVLHDQSAGTRKMQGSHCKEEK